MTLCYVPLRNAVRSFMLCYVLLCYVTLRYFMLRKLTFLLRYFILCYVMLCYVTLCYGCVVVLCCVVLCCVQYNKMCLWWLLAVYNGNFLEIVTKDCFSMDWNWSVWRSSFPTIFVCNFKQPTPAHNLNLTPLTPQILLWTDTVHLYRSLSFPLYFFSHW